MTDYCPVCHSGPICVQRASSNKSYNLECVCRACGLEYNVPAVSLVDLIQIEKDEGRVDTDV